MSVKITTSASRKTVAMTFHAKGVAISASSEENLDDAIPLTFCLFFKVIIHVSSPVTIHDKSFHQPNTRTGNLNTTLATQLGNTRLGCMEHSL